ncbi:SLC13 family permease [Aeribacillus composti]|jgi:solute carrier family 13 (sodium-dependent dicarboxylate transporter), member 2/3/5|uniref:SLC13 family permease n=1 Tax=Aeribacillus TaxID=1055323 RepID=UPI00119B633B|nr:SLC13 family permease [Aeribacillus composti]TVZ85747.1 anion transporter [Aeribacillus composti]
MSEVFITLFFLVFAIVMFVWEIIPLSITAMIVAVGLTVSGVLEPADAFAGFVNENVLLFMAMFIVGAAFFETGMAQKVGEVVTKFAKTEKQLIIAVMIVTGLMSGFLSNTGTAAVLIPCVIGIAAKSGFSRSRLLLPLVLAAAMGGNLSLIGAPGNMIAQSALQDIGLEFGFFEYAKAGLPILIVGILYFSLFGHKLLPKGEDTLLDSDSIYNKQIDYSSIPKWKQHMSFIVLVLTILAMVFEKQIGIKLYVSAWIGALILVAMRIISKSNAMKSIDMDTIMLFVGSFALAKAIDVTGTGAVIADSIIGAVGNTPSPYVLLFVILILSAMMTNFMSNTATTALLVPISLSIASAMDADPRAVLMATVIGGSMAYATPIGMPANTMVYGIGGYKFKDYVKAGAPLIIISIIVSMILLPIFFPFYR